MTFVERILSEISMSINQSVVLSNSLSHRDWRVNVDDDQGLYSIRVSKTQGLPSQSTQIDDVFATDLRDELDNLIKTLEK